MTIDGTAEQTREWGLWINGQDVRTAEDVIESRSPANGAPVARVHRAGASRVAEAVEAAAKAGLVWATTTPLERSRTLARLGKAIRENLEELNRWECAETGKIDARFEIEGAADYFEMYSGLIRALHGEVIDVGSSMHAFTRREPWGVVAVITPWNAPFNQAIREVAPAIAAGNTVVVKPASETSVTTLLFGRIAKEAGLPDGVYNVVAGAGGSVGAELVNQPLVRKVAFTGSVETGKRIAAMAADRLIPVTLELGGKSPDIIFADADLTVAIPAAVAAFTVNSGQACSAGTRLLVDRSIFDEVVNALRDEARRMVPGENLGPLITQGQRDTVARYFDIAKAEGAELVVGGTFATEGDLADGYYARPTIYAGVDSRMRIAKEEVFGPVLVVIPFDDEEHAIEIANDTSFGLVAGLWTRDVSRALRVATRLLAGNVYVNGWGAPIDVPFGGYKESGYGREKGLEALKDFTQIKSVVIHGID